LTQLWFYVPLDTKLVIRKGSSQTISRPSTEENKPKTTRRPASADRTARRQFQAIFPVITGSFPTNVIAHLHGLSMDVTLGRTVSPTVHSTVGWTVGLAVKFCKH